ncbi:MAG: B12-binding domain-containing radical SAM protein, partial [Acidobacteria bacterium]|nr:B12-binding domain-containing radical SAM protein [Acidobacteriota bacterium]
MRVAVILVWRPKNYPAWSGRRSPAAKDIPPAMSNDTGSVPYTAIHLASLFPHDWEVTLVHEMVRDVDLDMDVDAVFLSTMDFCAPHCRELAEGFRARDVKVIVGGLFPTLNPGYFLDVADAVVVGEAEPVMPALLADLKRNRLQRFYLAEKPADLADLPVPRYDLVETDFHVTMAYEATRGCPFTCSFCVLSAIRLPYRRRPVANVVRDLQAVPRGWSWVQRKYVIFLDNNLGADRRYFLELCEALAPLKKVWATETSIDTVTPESARAMAKAGCRFVYIGLESLSQESLQGSNKRHNKVHEYKQRIRWLHNNDVNVMSIFLVGLDGDTPEYLRNLPDLVDDVGVDVPVFSFAAPIEGTPFHQDLKDEGRLLPGDILGGMDGMHLLYKPQGLSPDELEMALFDCQRRAYSPGRVVKRVLRRAGNGFWST